MSVSFDILQKVFQAVSWYNFGSKLCSHLELNHYIKLCYWLIMCLTSDPWNQSSYYIKVFIESRIQSTIQFTVQSPGFALFLPQNNIAKPGSWTVDWTMDCMDSGLNNWLIIGLQFWLAGVKAHFQITQQHSFDVPWHCQLEVLIICTLHSYRRDCYIPMYIRCSYYFFEAIANLAHSGCTLQNTRVALTRQCAYKQINYCNIVWLQ